MHKNQSTTIKALSFLMALGFCFSISLFHSCEKAEEPDPIDNPIDNPPVSDTTKLVIEGVTVSNGQVTDTDFTTVTIKGFFSALVTESFTIGDYGHVVAKINAPDPTVNNNAGITNLGQRTNLGEFTSVIEGLESGTNYKGRVYIKKVDNSSGNSEYIYHDYFLTFTTRAPEEPAMDIQDPTNVTHNSFVISGEISDFKGLPVTDHGFVWSNTIAEPTIQNYSGIIQRGEETVSEDGSFFTEVIDGLLPNTSYYIRAFAVNENGVGYSNAMDVITQSSPEPLLVLDTISVFADANNTGEPNPGEVVTLNIVIDNLGLLPANDVLVNFNSTKLDVLTVMPLSFGNIVSYGSKTKQLEVQIHDNLSWGEIVDLFIEMEDIDGRQWTETYSFEVTSPYVVSENLLYYLDFENESLFNIGQVENLFGGLNGVVNGNIQLIDDTPTNSGFSMDFPGEASSYIFVPGDPLGDSPEFSISFWMKTADSDAYIFDGYHHGCPNPCSDDYNVGISGTKFISYNVLSNYHINNVILNNQWHHIVITKNNQGIQKLYINSEAFDEYPADSSNNYDDAIEGDEFWLGVDRDFQDDESYHEYTGKLDNFRLYNRVITDLEIQQIYAAKQ